MDSTEYFALAHWYSAVSAVANINFASSRLHAFSEDSYGVPMHTCHFHWSTSVMQTDFLQHNNFGASVLIYALDFLSGKPHWFNPISFLGKDSLTGQEPVTANSGIGTRSVNGSETMSLLEKKDSYGNKNPELILRCHLSRMHK